MGENSAGVDAAVERLSRLVETPPAQGSHEEREFERLLQEVADYLRTIETPDLGAPPSDIAARAERLVRKAEALHRSILAQRRRASLSSFPEDGKGIGPTTGV